MIGEGPIGMDMYADTASIATNRAILLISRIDSTEYVRCCDDVSFFIVVFFILICLLFVLCLYYTTKNTDCQLKIIKKL